MKSETTIRRELRAIEIALSRLCRSHFKDDSAYIENRAGLLAARATLRWMLGKINQIAPLRLNGRPTWGCIKSASQRPLVYILDKNDSEINAKAGLYDRRKDKRGSRSCPERAKAFPG